MKIIENAVSINIDPRKLPFYISIEVSRYYTHLRY
jgi:hypothetical protein